MYVHYGISLDWASIWVMNEATCYGNYLFLDDQIVKEALFHGELVDFSDGGYV